MLHNVRFDIKFVIKANYTISVLASLSWTMVYRKHETIVVMCFIFILIKFLTNFKKQDQCAKNKEESFPWEIRIGNNIK